MVKIYIPENPAGQLDPQQGAIRNAARALGLAHPVADRANWLLAARQGTIFRGEWPSTITSMPTTRIYHNPSKNCTRILVFALYDGQTTVEGSGSLVFTPQDGSGTTVTKTVTVPDGGTPFSSPRWGALIFACPITSTPIQYHEIAWTNLIVRVLVLMELPKQILDSDVDDMVRFQTTSFSGLESGRMITNHTTAGLSDIIAAIASARDATLRHGGGIILPSGSPWSMESVGSYGNIADSALLTSGFGFKMISRQIRQAVTSEEYTVRIHARRDAAGAGAVRITSESYGDAVNFSSLTTSLAWWAPDGGGTLSIDCTEDDYVYPLVQTDSGTKVEIASIQVIPV